MKEDSIEDILCLIIMSDQVLLFRQNDQVLLHIERKLLIGNQAPTKSKKMSIDSSVRFSFSHELLTTDFNERINSLYASVLHQLDTIPKSSASLEQIAHLLSIIFRFLRKNLQSHQKLSTEYAELSNSIEKLVSISAQYLHDRQEHENELLFLKDRISQILGQIGSTQESLEQYWTIIHRLEDETERLQGLLSNPQLIHSNQRRFQIRQETQRIKLDRLVEENEQMKQSIIQQTSSIEIIHKQMEIDLLELDKLKPLLEVLQLERKDIDESWLRIGLFFFFTSIVLAN